MSRKLRSLVVLIALTTLLPACAGFQRMMERNRYISLKTQEHVYQRSLPEVWPYARQLLFEQGYAVRNTGEAATFTFETEWRVEPNQELASRYLVQGFQLDGGACRVQFTRIESTPQGDRWNRDVALEWALLNRAEPEAAAQIAADGDRYASAQ